MPERVDETPEPIAAQIQALQAQVQSLEADFDTKSWAGRDQHWVRLTPEALVCLEQVIQHGNDDFILRWIAEGWLKRLAHDLEASIAYTETLRQPGARRLKPCPFCNGTRLTLRAAKPRARGHVVHCLLCDYDSAAAPTPDEATAIWNRRPREATLEDKHDAPNN